MPPPIYPMTLHDITMVQRYPSNKASIYNLDAIEKDLSNLLMVGEIPDISQPRKQKPQALPSVCAVSCAAFTSHW